VHLRGLNLNTDFMTHITIIVATDANRGIGIDNRMPWHLPEDMAHFKRLTSGHAVIMGRKTFDSIGRPLPNRRNIVISRNAGWSHDGVERAASLAEAIALAGAEPAFVIGGAQIYAQALPLCDELIITEVGAVFDCDAFFPERDPAVWIETNRQALHSDKAGIDYAFVTLRRCAKN
jgi:dihydrofolate reductase